MTIAPLRDDSALRALSSLRGLRGAPEASPLCRETWVSRTANVGTVGKNRLPKRNGEQKWVNAWNDILHCFFKVPNKEIRKWNFNLVVFIPSIHLNQILLKQFITSYVVTSSRQFKIETNRTHTSILSMKILCVRLYHVHWKKLLVFLDIHGLK